MDLGQQQAIAGSNDFPYIQILRPCCMIKSHLVLRTAPAKPVDESSFCGIYKYKFPHLVAHVVWAP